MVGVLGGVNELHLFAQRRLEFPLFHALIGRGVAGKE
jgi:hypothetical protein